MDTKPISIELVVYSTLGMLLVTLAFYAFVSWQRDRRIDRKFDYEQRQRDRDEAIEEAKRREAEKKSAIEAEDMRQYRERRDAQEAEIRRQAGGGSGGYIVVDLPDEKRSLFHDLLKGFEEYARLKGYGVAFSVDATFHDRIAFKFTLTDPDLVVSNERIRSDFKEYLGKIREGESLDDIPQVLSFEEHELLVSTLKNRVAFLQANFDLQQIKNSYLESLLIHMRSQSFLPAPSIVVQTGGSFSAPSYAALNSPQALVGHENTAQNRIHIAQGYTERREQIKRVEDLIARLQNEAASSGRIELERNIINVKEELEGSDPPDASRVGKWLLRAKQLLHLGSLGHETVFAAQELLKTFGLG
jgi:hypothetical protein